MTHARRRQKRAGMLFQILVAGCVGCGTLAAGRIGLSCVAGMDILLVAATAMIFLRMVAAATGHVGISGECC